MRNKNYKGRVEKIKLKKCDYILRAFDKVQLVYAEVLENRADIKEIKCNVVLDDLDNGNYTTDFICTKEDGSLMVRECTYRKLLAYPRTAKLLDKSREYWLKKGITDWGIVVDGEN